MLKKTTLLRAAIAASLTAGLTACGGGGSADGGTPPSETQDQTGRFIDSAVSGLEYEAIPSGQTGITNDDGEFSYREGDEVSFKLGALNFGKVAGKDILTPLDLTANDETKATKIAQVLQTLDDDGFPDNGITITGSSRTKAANQNPTDVANADLSDTGVAQMIIGLTSDNTVQQTAVVGANDALEHLNGTLDTLDPVESCSEGGDPLTAERISDKTFGFIASDEILIFQFAADGTLTENQYDQSNGGSIKDGVKGTWALNGNTLTLFGDEIFSACATDTAVLLEKNGEVGALYDVKPYTLTESTQSFLVSFLDQDKAVLSVESDGSLDYFPTETPISVNSKASGNANTGALDLDFDEGGVIDSIYFLEGQGKRTGIYLDYNESGDLAQIGIASIIPNPQPVAAETFQDKAFVYRNDDKNETVILAFNSNGTLEDFNNDFYNGGEQTATYATAQWSLDEQTQTITETYNNGETAQYKAAQSGVNLYWADPTDESEGIFTLKKTRSIIAETFIGSYTIDIPTENTRFNNLVVNENGDCSYSDTACQWTITESGKAQISFSHDETAIGHIWQLAGSSDKFAFVITHTDNINDVEPGLMTRD